MEKSILKDDVFEVVSDENVYVGSERRSDRRSTYQQDRVEALIKNFGLDRRIRIERRKSDSSWLLTSKKTKKSINF